MNEEILFAREDDREALNTPPDDTVDSQKYLIFMAGHLKLGVVAEEVVEILHNQVITYLPMVPDFIRGIINMRGQIVPIIDMRLKMGKFADSTDTTCIIVLEIDSTCVGIQVDGVEQVLDIDKTQISPIPVEDQQGLVDGMISLSSQEVLLFLNCQELIRTY